MTTKKRVLIYSSDIAILSGKSERQCRRILNEVKTALNKSKAQWLTIQEFAAYMQIDEEYIRKVIGA